MIVVKNSDWAETLDAYEKQQQEEKERWAAEQKAKGFTDATDGCTNVNFDNR